MNLEEALLAVWRQVLIEDKSVIVLEANHFTVRRTSRKRLRHVDFTFQSQELRGLEQNPDTPSRWAQLARQGKQVMQFLSAGRYLAVVVDGTLHHYHRPSADPETH